MTSKLKVNNIEDSSGNALISKCGSTLTLGKSGDTISLASKFLPCTVALPSIVNTFVFVGG